MLIDLCPPIGVEGYGSIHHHVQRRFGQWLHFHEPLIGKIWFDDCIAPIATPDVVCVVIDLVDQVLRFKIGEHKLPCIMTIHAPVFFRRAVIQRSRDVEDIYLWEIVSLPNPIIIRIMRRSDFDHSCAEG